MPVQNKLYRSGILFTLWLSQPWSLASADLSPLGANPYVPRPSGMPAASAPILYPPPPLFSTPAPLNSNCQTSANLLPLRQDTLEISRGPAILPPKPESGSGSKSGNLFSTNQKVFGTGVLALGAGVFGWRYLERHAVASAVKATPQVKALAERAEKALAPKLAEIGKALSGTEERVSVTFLQPDPLKRLHGETVLTHGKLGRQVFAFGTPAHPQPTEASVDRTIAAAGSWLEREAYGRVLRDELKRHELPSVPERLATAQKLFNQWSIRSPDLKPAFPFDRDPKKFVQRIGDYARETNPQAIEKDFSEIAAHRLATTWEQMAGHEGGANPLHQELERRIGWSQLSVGGRIDFLKRMAEGAADALKSSLELGVEEKRDLLIDELKAIANQLSRKDAPSGGKAFAAVDSRLHQRFRQRMIDEMAHKLTY
jgi:hypothetical protein